MPQGVPGAGTCWCVPCVPPCPGTLLPSLCPTCPVAQCPRAQLHSGTGTQPQAEDTDITCSLGLPLFWRVARTRSVSQIRLFSDVISHHGSCCCLCLSSFLNLVIETIRDEICSEQRRWLHEKLIFLRAVSKHSIF